METRERPSITDLLESPDNAGLRRSLSRKLGESLDAELSQNRVAAEEAPAPRGAGLKGPLLLLLVSLVMAGGFLGFSVRSYMAQTAAIFMRPSELFDTETMLIEALKKRTDIEIGKRDKLIAEYRNRAKERDAVAQAFLEAAKATSQEVAAQPKPQAPEPISPITPLELQPDLSPLVSERLNITLSQVAGDLRESKTGTAVELLDNLRKTLGSSKGADSAIAQSAIGISDALSSSIKRLESLNSLQNAKYDSVLTALETASKDKLASLARNLELERDNEMLRHNLAELKLRLEAPIQEAAAPIEPPNLTAAKALEDENSELRRRLADLTRRPAQAASEAAATPSAAASDALPSTGFLGTVSVIAGGRILIDLAQSGKPVLGGGISIFRPEGDGRGKLVGTAIIAAVRGSTIEASLQPGVDNATLRIHDAVYASPDSPGNMVSD